MCSQRQQRAGQRPGYRVLADMLAGASPSTMCMQCMIGAMSAGATATGPRAWLIARKSRWLTPSRQRHVTYALIALGVLAASVIAPSAA